MTDTISPSDRALIDAHIEQHGVTKCPTGAMATAIEYVWRDGPGVRGGSGLIAKEPVDWWSGRAASYKNMARAKRLRKAEA